MRPSPAIGAISERVQAPPKAQSAFPRLISRAATFSRVRTSRCSKYKGYTDPASTPQQIARLKANVQNVFDETK